MKTKTIIENIGRRLSIEHLNAMQQQMSTTDARAIILLAPTGSGKTLAFTIGMLRNIDMSAERRLTAIVIAPSRELVIQIAEVVRGASGGDLKVVALYGGHQMSDEVNSLSVTPDIVVATPGRLLDHIKRSTIDVGGVKTVVLDEYDKSLELGFLDEMRRIVKRIRRPSLRILTSATALDELPEFIGKTGEFEVLDYSDSGNAPRLSTTIVEVPSPTRDKIDTLVDLLRSLDNGKAIIFVNHRESAERVHERLKREGFPAGLYHGGLEQNERRLAVDMLNNGSTPVLVSTDLASRGLDIADVAYVIHYHMPPSQQAWTHRNGRTARMGATGTVYAIVSDGETIPEYVGFDRSFTPKKASDNPISSDIATIYFNAGKKEKISKGDIAGFLIQKGNLAKEEVGTITIGDHHAIAAIPSAKARQVIDDVTPHKLKNQRVRVTLLSR